MLLSRYTPYLNTAHPMFQSEVIGYEGHPNMTNMTMSGVSGEGELSVLNEDIDLRRIDPAMIEHVSGPALFPFSL